MMRHELQKLTEIAWSHHSVKANNRGSMPWGRGEAGLGKIPGTRANLQSSAYPGISGCCCAFLFMRTRPDFSYCWVTVVT